MRTENCVKHCVADDEHRSRAPEVDIPDARIEEPDDRVSGGFREGLNYREAVQINGEREEPEEEFDESQRRQRGEEQYEGNESTDDEDDDSNSNDSDRGVEALDGFSPSSPVEIVGCERSLMEGVVLIILEFVFLHCDQSPREDGQYDAIGDDPRYEWDYIKNVIGAACVIIPVEVFRDCLRRPPTNETIVALQEQVGKAMLRAARQEQQLRFVNEAVLTMDDFRLLYRVMLYHNLRLLQRSKEQSDEEFGWCGSVKETMNERKRVFAQQPVTFPEWFELADVSKSRRLHHVLVFLTKALPHFAAVRKFCRVFEPRLEHCARALDRENQEKFLYLTTITFVVREEMDRVDQSRAMKARAQPSSPLRNGGSSLAEPKSKNMRKLIQEHNSQKLEE